MVSNGGQRTLIFTVRAVKPSCRRVAATPSENSSTVRRSAGPSRTSRANVVSCDIDLASRSVSTGRSSSPLARNASERPVSPKRRSNSSSGSAARSPMVRSPSAISFSRVLGPTPHSISMGSGARKTASSPGGTTTRPLGLPTLVAILATSLLLATPKDDGRPVSLRMRACRLAAISPPGRPSPVKSRNASSTEMGSHRGVSVETSASTRCE